MGWNTLPAGLGLVSGHKTRRMQLLTKVARRYFSYFTHLSYIGLCSYFFAAGVQTLFYARSGRTSYPLQYWPKFLQALHVLLFATIATFRTSSCAYMFNPC